jgi:hypothetical protein
MMPLRTRPDGAAAGLQIALAVRSGMVTES